MTKQILTDYDFNNVSKIRNLPDGVLPQDAATVAQLTSAIQGLAWKDNVRVSTLSNINLNSPGTAIDGITLATNDRVLVRAQSQGRDNGLYIFNGSTNAMTRTTDADTALELESAVVTIDEGTQAGASYRQSTVNFTLGTTAQVWVSFGATSPPANETTAGKVEIATQAETDAGVSDLVAITPLKLATYSGRKLKYSADIGDASNTLYTVTHNLNTRDIHVMVRRNSGNFDFIEAEVRVTGVNTCDVVFSSAPTSNLYRVIVLG